MSIKWFNDLKFNNSGGAISATLYGEWSAVGSVNSNNTYTTNGYSSNGLDISIAFSAAHYDQYYVQKNTILPGNSTYTCLGFNIQSYTYQWTPISMTSSAISSYPGWAIWTTATSPDGLWLAVGGQSGTTAYKHNGDGTFSTTTFTSITNCRSLCFNALGNQLLIGAGGAGSQVVTIYNVTSSGITASGNTVTGSSTTGGINYMAFDPANYYLVVGYDTSQFLRIFQYNNSTGLYSTSGLTYTAPTVNIRAVAWAPNGQYFAGCGNGNSTLYVYSNNYSGTFTQFTATLPTSTNWGIAWSPDSQYIAIASSTSGNYLAIFKNNNNNTFTQVSSIPQPANGLIDVKFSADGKYLIGATSNSQGSYIWNNNGGVFTLAANPSTGGTSQAIECGPLLSYTNKFYVQGSTASTGQNLYVYNVENKIFTLSNTTTTASNYGAILNSRLWATLTYDKLNLYFRNSSGTVSSASTLLSNLSLTNVLSNCYMEIEINSAVASLYVNGSLALQVTDTNLETFQNNPLTLMFNNYGYSTSSGYTNIAIINNVYLLDGTGSVNKSRLGPVTVDVYYPTSDNTVAWATSTGTTHYTLVNENPPDGDTSYVQTATFNASDVLNIGTQSTATTVFASGVFAIARTISGGGDGGGISLNSDGSATITYTVNTAYTMYNQYADSPALNTTITYQLVH